MRAIRLILVGALLHTKHLSRSPLEIALAVMIPVVYMTLAVYLFGASDGAPPLPQAAVGAGLMGVWTSVLFGSGGAVQNQRWQGTLEMLMLSPTHPVLVFLPITVATAITGTYSMVATILCGSLLFGIRLDFAEPVAFAFAVPTCMFGFGMLGLLLASTFVLMRNANALSNVMEYPIWLLSGMLVPLTVLPSWTSGLATVLPTTWAARALQASVVGGPAARAILMCLATSGVCLMLGALAFRRVERRARVSATLGLA
jgi:ABC-2 type transport system permease protein